ncbi:MAG: Mini-ribonuclease 3 [Lachnospiraceae bacterium]|jgi:ribonuclease-3 family protein
MDESLNRNVTGGSPDRTAENLTAETGPDPSGGIPGGAGGVPDRSEKNLNRADGGREAAGAAAGTETGPLPENFEAEISAAFSLQPKELSSFSPLVLAWIGDAVYELAVRSILAERHREPVNRLHRSASQVVKAGAQAAVLRSIDPLLTPEERAVMRRGRNAKSYTMAKNATMSDYRHATALEALCGWLYLKGRNRRLAELLKAGLDRSGILSPGEEQRSQAGDASGPAASAEETDTRTDTAEQ